MVCIYRLNVITYFKQLFFSAFRQIVFYIHLAYKFAQGTVGFVYHTFPARLLFRHATHNGTKKVEILLFYRCRQVLCHAVNHIPFKVCFPLVYGKCSKCFIKPGKKFRLAYNNRFYIFNAQFFKECIGINGGHKGFKLRKVHLVIIFLGIS